MGSKHIKFTVKLLGSPESIYPLYLYGAYLFTFGGKLGVKWSYLSSFFCTQVFSYVFFKKSTLFFNKLNQVFGGVGLVSRGGTNLITPFTKKNYKTNLLRKETLSYPYYSLENLIDLRKFLFSMVLENRRIFKNFVFLKRRRTKKFTNLIKKLTNQTLIDKIYYLYMNVYYFLWVTFFSFSKKDSKSLIQNTLIYLNGVLVRSSSLFFKKKSLFELIFPKSYLFFLWSKLGFYKNVLLVGLGASRFKGPKKLILLKTDPALRFSGKDFISTLKMFEVDTQTFSFFLFPQTLDFLVYSYFFKKKIPIYTINLLNWRYNY